MPAQFAASELLKSSKATFGRYEKEMEEASTCILEVCCLPVRTLLSSSLTIQAPHNGAREIVGQNAVLHQRRVG